MSEAPTILITNDRTATAKALIERYARRMTIEQRLAESIVQLARRTYSPVLRAADLPEVVVPGGRAAASASSFA